MTGETNELETRSGTESYSLEQICEAVQRAKTSGFKPSLFDIGTNESCHSLQREGRHVIGQEEVYEKSIYTGQHADRSSKQVVIVYDPDEGNIAARVTNLICMKG